MVKIKQNVNKNLITAASSKTGGAVIAGADASIYYSNLSKEWACKMPASVDGTEYSAKYYMEKTKQKALDSVSDIGDAKDNAILALQNAGDEILDSVEEILDSVEEILDSAEEIYNQTESKANEILNLILNYANTTLSNVSSIDSGSAVQTALNNKADKDLSNLSTTASPNFDGQWVQSNGTVISASSGQATGTYSFSLSSYLPNDSYSYEVILNVVAKTASNYNGIVFKSDYIAPAYTTASYSQFICTTTTTAGNLIMPIGSNKNLDYVIGSNGTDYLYIRLYAYRRIGTNG